MIWFDASDFGLLATGDKEKEHDTPQEQAMRASPPGEVWPRCVLTGGDARTARHRGETQKTQKTQSPPRGEVGTA